MKPRCPFTASKVKKVAASLRAGRYRSAEPYFHRARMEQIRRLEKPPDVATIDAMKRYARAVARGVGPLKLKDAIDMELVADHASFPPQPPTIEEIAVGHPNACVWPAGLFVLGSWWLTRGIEASAARVKHVAFDQSAPYTVSWTLPASKSGRPGVGGDPYPPLPLREGRRGGLGGQTGPHLPLSRDGRADRRDHGALRR